MAGVGMGFWLFGDVEKFSAGVGAAEDFEAGFRDVEIFGESCDEGLVGLAVVGAGMKVDREFAGGGGDDFFLGGAGFDGDEIAHARVSER